MRQVVESLELFRYHAHRPRQKVHQVDILATQTSDNIAALAFGRFIITTAERA
jgi:hypothetical protein